MSFLDYLFCLFIQPLKLLFEVVFFYAYRFTGNVGISIVVISLVINILVLPLYKRADKLEKEQLEKKKKQYRKEMDKAVKELDFEKAAQFRDAIIDIENRIREY